MTQEIIGRHPNHSGLHLAPFRSGDSDLLVSVSDDAFRVWDPRTRTLLIEVSDDFPGVNGIAVCPLRGRPAVIAIGTEDGVFWVDTATGASSYPTNDAQAWALATAGMPDGSVRVFGAAHSDPFPVECWDAATGASLRPVGFHDTSIKSVATIALPGGPLVAAGDDGGEIRRWNPLTAAEVGQPIGGRHVEVITALAPIVLPDGRALLAFNGSEGRLWRCDARTGEPIGEPIAADSDRVYGMIGFVAEDRPQLISFGSAEALRRWDAVTGALLDEPMAGRFPAVFTVDGVTMLAAASEDGTIVTRPLTRR